MVRRAGKTSWPTRFWFVPMRPTLAPRVCSRIVFSKYVVVVFPLVPVTPIRVMRRPGSPNQWAAIWPNTARGSSVTSQGPSWPVGGVWQRTAVAPLSRASRMKRFPSVRLPRKAAKRAPGVTVRLSQVRPVISRSGTAAWSSRAVPRSSLVSSKGSHLHADGPAARLRKGSAGPQADGWMVLSTSLGPERRP